MFCKKCATKIKLDTNKIVLSRNHRRYEDDIYFKIRFGLVRAYFSVAQTGPDP